MIHLKTILGNINIRGCGAIKIKLESLNLKLTYIIYTSQSDIDIYTAFCIETGMHYSHEYPNLALKGMHKNIISDINSTYNKSIYNVNENFDELLNEIKLDNNDIELLKLYQIYLPKLLKCSLSTEIYNTGEYISQYIINSTIPNEKEI